MSGEKIQVREGWWRQRCGNVVRIAGESGNARYPWRCVSGRVYGEAGRLFAYEETQFDLVEFLGKNITITSAEWRDKSITPEQEQRAELVTRFALAIVQSGADPMIHDVWQWAEEYVDAKPKIGGES